eukprot:1142058-Pelagomonas_calceolata.AAC.4
MQALLDKQGPCPGQGEREAQAVDAHLPCAACSMRRRLIAALARLVPPPSSYPIIDPVLCLDLSSRFTPALRSMCALRSKVAYAA